ncbi:MAG: rhodanese-like domain-containing protein [Colwellia sp.]|nr:rhodanese-like domain-containing protein [Colwellia sp.]
MATLTCLELKLLKHSETCILNGNGYIANAVNIPHKELAARLAELSDAKNSQIVIYCRSGRRAEVAKQVLVKSGFAQLDHLTGDFNEWTSNGLPISTGN